VVGGFGCISLVLGWLVLGDRSNIRVIIGCGVIGAIDNTIIYVYVV